MKIPQLCCLMLFGFVQLNAQIEWADQLSLQEKYDEANKIYEDLRRQKISGADSLEIGIKMAVNYHNQRASQLALELLQSDLARWEDRLDADALIGLAYHKMGVSYFQLENYPQAIEQYKKAASIRSDHYHPNHESVLKSLQNVAGCYYNLQDYEEARKYYQLIVDRAAQNPNVPPQSKANVFLNLGSILSFSNDFEQAETYITTGVNLTETYLNDDFYALDHAYNKALIYYFARDDGEGIITYAQKILELYLGLEADELYVEDYYRMADCYNNLGIGYEKLEQYSRARRNYGKSITLNEAYEAERKEQLADNYNNLADLYRKTGNLNRALQYINKAIGYEKQLNRPQELSIEYYNRGEIFFESDEFEKALWDYQKALELFVFDFSAKRVTDNPATNSQLRGYKPELVNILADKARILSVYGTRKNEQELLEAALATYDTAALFIDRIRLDFESDESKTFLTSRAKSIYEQAIKVCFQLFERTKQLQYQERAFQYFERSKALILLDALVESNAKKLARITPVLQEKESDLQQSLTRLEQQLYNETNDTIANRIRLEIIEKKRELSLFLEELEKANPTYHQLKYQVRLPQLRQVQGTLAADQGILEYLVGKEKIYWFFVGPQQFFMDTIAVDFPLQEWIRDFRTSIYEPFVIRGTNKDSLYAVYARKGHQLYQKLLSGIVKKIQNCKRLRIIPDGVLGYLPFDALLTTDVAAANITEFVNYPYFHHDYMISYNYSVALLQEMDAVKELARRRILAFAPSFSVSQAPLWLGNNEIRFSPLFENIKTTETITKMIRGRLFGDNEALKSVFLENAPYYAYLHLASHALMNEEDTDYSFISFTQAGDSVSADQLLFLKELYNLRLNAEMVVLSACETGVGELAEGEGIISLARAFSYAGTRSIITSLWQVSEQKTGDLMIDFYQNLKDGLTKDEALHLAKDKMISKSINAHPYYWSSFIAIGNMESIVLSNGITSYWWIGLIAVFALFAGLYISNRKQQKA